MKQTRVLFALLVAVILGLAGCAGAPATREPGDGPIKLKVGSTLGLSTAHLFVAQEKGYFAAEGLEVEITPAVSTDAQSLVAARQMDAYFGSLAASFFNGIANGLDVKILGELGTNSADGRATIEMLVRSDSGITSVADLKGKNVVIPSGKDTSTGWVVNRLLQQGGLTVNDVNVTRLAVADAPIALVNRQVDAAIAIYPALADLLKDGQLKVVGDMYRAYELGGSAFFVGPSLTVDDRDAGVRFLRALNRAVTQDLQGDYFKNPEIVRILSKWTKIPEDLIVKCPPPAFPPGMPLKPAALEDMQTYFRGQGVLTYEPNQTAAQLTDADLVAAAQSGPAK